MALYLWLSRSERKAPIKTRFSRSWCMVIGFDAREKGRFISGGVRPHVLRFRSGGSDRIKSGDLTRFLVRFVRFCTTWTAEKSGTDASLSL